MVLDLVLMAAAFAAARSGNAGLMCYSFGPHFLAALTVRLLFFTLVFDSKKNSADFGPFVREAKLMGLGWRASVSLRRALCSANALCKW